MLNLDRATKIEIDEVEREIVHQEEYMGKIQGGKFNYLSVSAKEISTDLNEWLAGRESPRQRDKYTNYEGRGSEVSSLVKENGLSQAEATAIGVYTASDYLYMNPAMENSDGWMASNLPKVTSPMRTSRRR